MELGPLQKLWINTLREHPERQIIDELGTIHNGVICACCLGQYLLCKMEFEGMLIPENANLFEIETSFGCNKNMNETLQNTWIELGLRSEYGTIGEGEEEESLARMNDDLVPWPAIADFIENNKEIVFTKSV